MARKKNLNQNQSTTPAVQKTFIFEDKQPMYEEGENPNFLTSQIITYIGNKRSLLDFIGQGVNVVQHRLGKKKLDLFDVFTGSGIVARYFKQYANLLIANDLEQYATLMGECYLSNQTDLDIRHLKEIYRGLCAKIKKQGLQEGVVTRLYAPKNDNDIQMGERVFYTHKNAMYIDTMRELISKVPKKYQKYYLAPLLVEASIHANTSGVFKGFHKNKETGCGQFGGTNKDALIRIKGDIELPFPIFSNYSCDCRVYNGDSNDVIKDVEEVDLAYLDPPYNQHPYGSNYFMLNLILNNKEPEQISKVSGIPEDWNRSAYNKRQYAYNSLSKLVEEIKAKFVLISFNSEGFISLNDMTSMLQRFGSVCVLEREYNTFRGCRNIQDRDIHVTEYLYLLEKN